MFSKGIYIYTQHCNTLPIVIEQKNDATMDLHDLMQPKT